MGSRYLEKTLIILIRHAWKIYFEVGGICHFEVGVDLAGYAR